MATSIRQGSQEYEAKSHLHISEQCTFSNGLDNQICINFAGLAPSDFLEDHVPFLSLLLMVQMKHYQVLV